MANWLDEYEGVADRVAKLRAEYPHAHLTTELVDPMTVKAELRLAPMDPPVATAHARVLESGEDKALEKTEGAAIGRCLAHFLYPAKPGKTAAPKPKGTKAGGPAWLHVECPECGYEKLYDNRGDKPNPDYPDFKCAGRGVCKWGFTMDELKATLERKREAYADTLEADQRDALDRALERDEWANMVKILGALRKRERQGI